jgi:hypothetical protein
MLDNHPRHQLRFIIEKYGRSIIDDPRRCRGMLKDLAPKHQRETNLLMLALDQKLVAELTQKTHTPILMHLDILAQRLHNNIGIQKDFAVWAIESWALALDVIQQPSAQKIITPEPEQIISPIATPKTALFATTSTAEYKIGRFVVHNAIARDTKTNLVWLRLACGQKFQGGKIINDARLITWHEAVNIVKTINQQPDGFAGRNDWRIPAFHELQTLSEKEKNINGCYINNDIFPNRQIKFWTSSNRMKSNDVNAYDSILTIQFDYLTQTTYCFKDDKCSLLLVRSEPELEFKKQKIGKFIVQDGVATDTETGLMWLRFAHGQRWENGTVVGDAKKLIWDDAMKIPDTFNRQGYAGYNNWRVPNIYELKSLIDKVKGTYGNYIDADVFPQNEMWFWSSLYDSWVVNFYVGYSGSGSKYYDYNVRLVRN